MIGSTGSMPDCMMATAFPVPAVCAVHRPGSRNVASPLKHGHLFVRRIYRRLPLQLAPTVYKGPVCLFNFKKQPKLPEVVQAGDPVLHEPAREVLQDELSTARVQGIIDNMVGVIRRAPAVGLAAPQIGIPLQIIVLEDTAEYISYASPQDVAAQRRFPFDLVIIINPKLKSQSTGRARFFEGCLSVEGYRALVERHLEVEVSGLDRYGHPIVVKATGWQARILQHECDHLQGHLYVEKMISKTFRTVTNLLLPLPEGCPKPGACESELLEQARNS